MKEQLLSEARKYLNTGFSIIPVNLLKDENGKYQKKPLVRWQDYQKIKASDHELLKWASFPSLNGLGAVTGEISGIVVLDIDNPELLSDFDLPLTPRVRSISGGYHYYFKYPHDLKVKNHQALLPKVDIRADGGFIVIPPSGIDDEHSYIWEQNFATTPLAEIPTWLRDLLEVAQSPEFTQIEFDPEKAVEAGSRHKTSLQAIGYLSRKYHSEGLDKIWDRLLNWVSTKFSVSFGQEDMAWLKGSFDRYAPKNIASSTRKSPARLIELVVEGKFGLFKTTKDKKTYIGKPEQPLIVIPTDSEEFYDTISLEYYGQYRTPLTNDSLKKVLPTIRALINEKGEEIQLSNRVASKDGHVYYDLFEDNVFVSVSNQGVQIVGPDAIRASGLRFVRYSHQQPQCMPKLDAPISDAYLLFDFLAIKDEEQKMLLLCHLVASLVPNISRCMLVFQGSRGSAKSTSQRLIRFLIDPASPALLRIPKSSDDLQIFLEKNYFCCFDNVSWISKEVSDSLCMMITGGGTLKRKLFTDNEIVTTDLKSCLAINGINLAIHEPDLLERSLIIETTRLEAVRSEEELMAEFERAKSRILGGIFSLLASTLQSLPSQAPGAFRMADYYRYASAAAISLGSTREQFEQIFQRNIDRQNEAAIESSPLAQVIVDFISDKSVPSELKSSELYSQLSDRAKEMGVEKGMPNGAHNLWKKLNPLRVDLEGVGILVEKICRRDGTYIRIVKSPSVEAAEAAEAEEIANSF